MAFKWRRYNNAIHRDFGYFFFGVTLIYAISGIALNHKVMKDWNPEYVIKRKEILLNDSVTKEKATKEYVIGMLKLFEEEHNYKNHYFPYPDELKIFLEDGSVVVNTATGKATMDINRKRQVFNQFNFLHYNPNRWWTWFADIYAGALAILALTGLFVLKGKNGITRRGAWITVAGVLIPIIFLFLF